MMQKRLKLAKKLLNPRDSVLIVTIDEKEYLHLGCLLEEMFSGFKAEDMKQFNLPKLKTKIDGPAIIVIPIAIYA